MKKVLKKLFTIIWYQHAFLRAYFKSYVHIDELRRMLETVTLCKIFPECLKNLEGGIGGGGGDKHVLFHGMK